MSKRRIILIVFSLVFLGIICLFLIRNLISPQKQTGTELQTEVFIETETLTEQETEINRASEREPDTETEIETELETETETETETERIVNSDPDSLIKEDASREQPVEIYEDGKLTIIIPEGQSIAGG